MGLFSSKDTKTYSLMLHLGSGSVGAAIIENSTDEKLRILYTVRESIVLRKNAGEGKEFAVIKTSLDRIIERTLVAARAKSVSTRDVSRVVCVLSSPWYVSQTKIVSLEHKDTVTINSDFVDSLVEKEIAAFKNELDKKRENPDSPDENILVESHVIHIKLNGYPVAHPIGKKAQTVEVAMIMSFTPQGIISAVTEAVRRFSSSGKIAFHTLSLAGFSVVRDISPDTNSFIFTEVGGEVTDVAIAKKGILLETISLPVGSNTLVRAISESLNVLPDVALSYLSIDASSTAHQDLQSSINAAKQNARDAWLKSFGNALAVFSEEIFLPRDLFLIAEQGTGDFFLDLIKKSEFKEIAFTSTTVRASLLSGHTLSDFVAYDTGVPRDSFLSLITLFHRKIS